MRLQKLLADAGLASRRAAEELIRAGRVTVNGETVTRLGTQVEPTADRVTLDGKVVRVRRKLYVAINKPPGYLCTRTDPQGRRTVGQLLPKEWASLYTVGRLDRDTEGLLFLTNDGDFCLRLTHPRYGVRKTYLAEIEGQVARGLVAGLTQGVEDDGERIRAETARVLESNHTRSLVRLTLREGKYHEVRRLFAALGLGVLGLRRIEIGPIKLGELPSGRWRVLTAGEVQRLFRESEPDDPSGAGKPRRGDPQRRRSIDSAGS
jgi:pseudouridine synthase